MSELVLLHHNEPMTTSLAIADGVEMAHASVIKLVRKYVDELQNFGPSGFEIQKGAALPHGGNAKSTEIAYLNEGQSIFLLTLMRNSEIVVRFKIALVKAFLELRAKVNGGPQQIPAHAADYAVAAARSFNAMMRAGRAMGLPLATSAVRANDCALRRSGVDVMAEMGISVADLTAPPPEAKPDPIGDGVAAWATTAGAGPWTMQEIAAQAFGLTPAARRYAGIITRMGPALSSAGFIKRRYRYQNENRWYWERAGSVNLVEIG